MIRVNDIYIDENNNSWDVASETLDSATYKSKTLVDCRNCRNCKNCNDCFGCVGCIGCHKCVGCFRCFACFRCFGCFDCSKFRSNPQRYTTDKIGSRNSQTTFYWVKNEKTQVVCGCFIDSLAKFEEIVNKVYPSGEYHDQYMNEINLVKTIINN